MRRPGIAVSRMVRGIGSLSLVGALGLLAMLAMPVGCAECGETAVTARPMSLGEACDTDLDCESGLCDSLLGGARVCLKPCAHGCDTPGGEICTTLSVANEQPRQACVPDKGGLCLACAGDSDCPWPGDRCLKVEGKGVCGRDCSFDNACPGGFVCGEARDLLGVTTASQCQPVSGTCECTPPSAGQTRSCTITNSYGSCGGMETCDPARGFVGCDARVPQAEQCNNLDDNCDGRIDEDSASSDNPLAGIPPKTCGRGACFREVPGCIDGEVPACVPGEPVPEICNGVDDNCDGRVDEDYPTLGQPCSNGLGSCQRSGVMVCTLDGTATACGAVPGPPAEESCNRLDDDCNGSIDDMGTVSCGIGVCTNTVVLCQNGQLASCQPLNGNQRSEVCNGLDDDCDGVVDNGFDLQTDLNHCGQCGNTCSVRNGAPDCDSGQCLVKACNTNQGFDDCDGRYSTGCEQDIWSSLDHCGGCNQACAFPHASARCAGGSCSIGPCASGWYDANDDASDGCEYACTWTSNTDVPDDAFTDSNCDGIDGELDNAVFVDCGAGNDTGPGTRAQPLKSIGRALQVATPSGRNQILVATALCNETITLKEGVGLYGGYNNQTWKRSFANRPVIQPSSGALPAVSANGIAQATALDGFVISAAAGISPSGSSIGISAVNSSGLRISNCDIRAATGAPGVNGSPGQNGPDGLAGNPGQTGTDNGDANGFGGLGGASTCGSGGSGGRGGYDQGNGLAGIGGSKGATSGSGGAWGACSTGSGRCDRRGGTSGNAGLGGGTGVAGANAAGGGGVGVVLGSGQFIAAHGGDGTDGTDGGSGAGGGGGGGGASRMCTYTFFCTCVNACNADRGGGGGGGGGAGCGGKRGTAGTGGGGSIGVLLVNSSPVIRNTAITTADGGKGGNGGGGGTLGTGGTGGGGGARQDDSGDGGNGGRGGNGGKGGDGGGGGGGPSIAVYKASGSLPTLTGMTYTTGQGGQGGAGGNAGNGGAPGVKASVHP